MYEDTGLHVPMIIRWPKSYPAPSNYESGSVKEEVVSLIDLTPPLLGLQELRNLMACMDAFFSVIRSVRKEPTLFRTRPSR